MCKSRRSKIDFLFFSVVWLRDLCANTYKFNLAGQKGIPLCWDFQGNSNQYYDFNDPTRTWMTIFNALRSAGWPGNYYTNQANQPIAGFGFRSDPKNGIEDWGLAHDTQGVICQQFGNGMFFLLDTKIP